MGKDSGEECVVCVIMRRTEEGAGEVSGGEGGAQLVVASCQLQSGLRPQPLDLSAGGP